MGSNMPLAWGVGKQAGCRSAGKHLCWGALAGRKEAWGSRLKRAVVSRAATVNIEEKTRMQRSEEQKNR